MSILQRLAAMAMVLHTGALYSTDEGYTIDVEIDGAKPAVGQVLVSLFDSQENYLKAPLNEAIAKVDQNGSASVTLGKYKTGEYAIVVIYDKNSNGKLDTGLFRIPTEKIGYSNNVSSRLGPAKWASVRFLLTNSDVNKRIQLKKAKRKK